MGGRIYDPTIGRMLQADIIVQAPTNILSYNRYAYVINNPVNLIDPTGYAWEMSSPYNYSNNDPDNSGCSSCGGDGPTDDNLNGPDRNTGGDPTSNQPLNADSPLDDGEGEADGSDPEENSKPLALRDPDDVVLAGVIDPRLVALALAKPIAKHIKIGIQKLKELVGKPNPTKKGALGKPQPFDAKTGRFLEKEANPGIVHSPLGRFGAGFSQGFAEAYSGVNGATPLGAAGELGHTLGNITGTIAGLF